MSVAVITPLPLAAKRDALLAQLGGLRHPQERLQWLVEQARRRPSLATGLKTEADRVPGCLANLWLVAETREGRCLFQCDSDSQIVRAVAGLLCDFYSGQTPAEILGVEPGFLEQVGINQHLTANRRNVLSRVWERIRTFADEQRAPQACTLNQSPHGTDAKAAKSKSPFARLAFLA